MHPLTLVDVVTYVQLTRDYVTRRRRMAVGVSAAASRDNAVATTANIAVVTMEIHITVVATVVALSIYICGIGLVMMTVGMRLTRVI